MSFSEIVSIVIPVVVSQVAVQIVSHCRQSAQLDKRLSLLEYKVDALSGRVDKHNNLDVRLTKIESMMEVK